MSFSTMNGSVDETLQERIETSKIFVVGAGGIGCELLKNLVLTGFHEIHVIDLDTIELSNLNRQFLFRKQHIGKPKALIAKQAVEVFNPKVKIEAYHDSVTSERYDVEFFRQFDLVANALDNIPARIHVNRLCLAAEVPLVESGSAGYLGQCTVHKKGVSECYECVSRKGPKTYPMCTIRNTPSEPAHCVVWAKHLFNQLFGEIDFDSEVSPDLSDPNLGKDVVNENEAGNVIRVSTRQWAQECKYNSQEIFEKLFVKDINHLNEMHDLWKHRKRPVKLDWEDLPDSVPENSKKLEEILKDRKLWSIKQCRDVFKDTISALKEKTETGDSFRVLTWDKDDDLCMDFVAAAANLRSHCFHIPTKSKFDLKSIAGNIIPAIAATNAMVAGLMVLQMLNVLDDFSKCRNSYIASKASSGRKLISNSLLEKPNPECIACTNKIPELKVSLNEQTCTMKTFHDKVLKESLHMIAPDIMMDNRVLVSSDPEDRPKDCFEKTLAAYNVKHGSNLLCEDFQQDMKIVIVIQACKDYNDQDYEFESDRLEKLNEKDSTEAGSSTSSILNESGKRPISEVSESDANTTAENQRNEVPNSEAKSTEGETSVEPPLKKTKTGEN